PWKIFHAIHECRCRDRDTEFCGSTTKLVGCAAHREIQIDWNLAGESDCEICDHRTFARGQNNGDSRIGKFFAQETAERGCGSKKLRAAQLAMIHSVDQRGAETFSFQTADAGFAKMLI